jgi:EAL domain-containing protein (putative c-di-GMP-specific phosphodiesterase class I)
MIEIGDWVVRRVARTIAAWSVAGFTGRLAINVSPRQIDHADFFQRLRIAMHDEGAPARLLELEITETLAMHARADVIAAMAALRHDGAVIAIDGFGTGYSNLSRLRGLPIDRIKLDRSLVAPIADDARARAIAQALIGLIHGLGCQAVAEGVETSAQADMLRVIGCDAMQGYGVAAPMDEAAFFAWTRRNRRRKAG